MDSQAWYVDDEMKMETDPIDLDIKVKLDGGSVVWDDGMDLDSKFDNEASTSDAADPVVREIDVFLVPNLDSDTKLYLLQYPLRPYWRPYGLDTDRCQEVRVKHTHNKLEVDLLVDTAEENYNHNADDHFKTKLQTLTSTQGNLSTGYAMGILQGDKLHLNPLHAIMQMRPSMKYLDAADDQKKRNVTFIDDKADEAVDEGAEAEVKPSSVALKVLVKKETERQQQSRLMSFAHLKQLEESEPWINLEPHGLDSPVSDEIKAKMKVASNNQIPFKLQKKEFLEKLVPGRTSLSVTSKQVLNGAGKEPLAKSYWETLPLDKRLETLLSQGNAHVLSFERVMKLVPPGCKEVEVLDVLRKRAWLIQGCWVATSQSRYKGDPIRAVRDYILFLFSRDRVILHQQLEQLKVAKEKLREILVPIAVQKPAISGWEFIETTDKLFIKRHQQLVNEWTQILTKEQQNIKTAAFAYGNKAADGKPRVNLAVNLSAGKPPPTWTLSDQTLSALPGALQEIFSKNPVCNLQFICLSLRDLAITKSQSEGVSSEELSRAIAAAKAASAPSSELAAAVDQVASNIEGIYFLTSLGDVSLDPFREIVIALLKQKGLSGKLQRGEVMEASQRALKRVPSTPVFLKVMKELCYSRGGTWVLKAGDGRPG